MHQPYPSTDQPPQTPGPAIPATVTWAVRLMYAGAVVSLADAAFILTQGSAIHSALRQEFPTYTASQLASLQATRVDGSLVGGLIGAVVWVAMARSNQAGKVWARNVAGVLFGLASLSLGLSFTGPVLAGLLAGAIITWLIGLGSLIALWLKPSRQYQEAMSQR